MTTYPRNIAAWLRRSIAAVVVLAVLVSPLGAVHGFAQSSLYPGAVALIANTGGQPILLRETPSFDAAVLGAFYEGTPADVLEGPVYDAAGAAWFGVAIGGVTGYIVGGYLSDGGVAPAPEPAPVELAQEAIPAEAVPVEVVATEALPAPAASLAEVPVNPVATADLNLRAGPSYDDAVLLVIPAGASLIPTGEFAQGFAGVTYDGAYGWVDTSWLGDATAPQAQTQETVLAQDAAPVDPATASTAEAPPLIGDLAAAPAGEAATVGDVVNLRAGPSYDDTVLRVIPPGGMVTITGATDGGWAPVWYNGTWGYINTEFLLAAPSAAGVTLAQDTAPAETAAAPESGAMQAMTLSDVNLRAAPDLNAQVMMTVPPGAELTPLAGPEAGFYQVQYGDNIGWIAAEYLEISASYLQRADRNNRQDGKVEGSKPARNAEGELGAGGIIWPVSGGLWYVMQGYNGSSHQNRDGLWQYYYSLDLARRDGETAGQQIISPVNGVVRWTDPGSGGISIDIGNGYAVAMFHVAFMAGLEAGTTVRQGQYLGEISGPGGPGFASSPHVQITLWQSNDNGNWDRRAAPFTGRYAIGGTEFPDMGGNQQYTGMEFSP